RYMLSGVGMDRGYLQENYQIFEAGCSYRVLNGFSDYRRMRYKKGDELTFIGSNFVPYEDGLSLFFSFKGNERQIMLCVREGFQINIAHNLSSYFERVHSNPR
ncbi:DUF3601 domain-containing protein, partial [Enterovibrio norvegicus]|uniref:DUF3601 domain-containing protein n=1 Tax=Enterovibrio norvegicus TaxID=188144 RepID=UPI00354F69C5